LISLCRTSRRIALNPQLHLWYIKTNSRQNFLSVSFQEVNFIPHRLESS